MNKVCFIGNLVKDSEYQKAGCLQFSVAVNEKHKNAKGDYEDYANYFDCVMFGDRAKSLEQYLTKGKKIACEGKLHQSRWEDKDGNKRSKVEITVDNVDLLTPKSND